MKRLRYWQKVLWSDESRICLYYTDDRVHVQRLPGESLIWPCVQETVAGGGCVGCALFRPHSQFKSVEGYFEFPKSDRTRCLNPTLGLS